MKRTLLAILLIYICLPLSATKSENNESTPSLYEQLVNLNVKWLLVDNTEDLKKVHVRLSEKELIRTHLLLVEKRLRATTNKGLNAIQKQNRNKLLNELRSYANESVFPINTYHLKRTPYFIDDIGTACAVGQLIIKSGNEEFAESISSKYNYSLIEDMPKENLSIWAFEHGFSLDELKWIQPSYGPVCSPGQVIQPRCRNTNGCFNPNWRGDSLTSPVTMVTNFMADGTTNWIVDSNNTWQFMGAYPGTYVVTITDSLNKTKTYNYTIINPPAIELNEVVVSHNSDVNCNGKVTISPTLGIPPYTIMLYSQALNYNESNTTGVFDSLCDGSYTIVVVDSSYCQSSGTIQVDNTTGIKEVYLNDAFTVQNPFSDNLIFSSELKGKKIFTLYTLQGKKIFEKEVLRQGKIETSDIKDGVYLLQLNINGNLYQKKVVKAN